MAFRRQDIPRTIRKSAEGGPRRLFPRYIRDMAPMPKIELAIAYLDEMVGRRRADLSPDVILDLFGDLKLARCLVACLSDSYRYRSPDLADVVGEEAALALAGWDLMSPADVRGHVYQTLNQQQEGVVALDHRAGFLAEVAAPLGLSGDLLGEVLHLDAERNQILIRVGPRPRPDDVAARFNALLTYSILRQASSIELTLPGIDTSLVETLCARDEVTFRRVDATTIRLQGRRASAGRWTPFGGRLARTAVHLLVACPHIPTGQAIVHLNDEPLRLVLDFKSIGPLRPSSTLTANTNGLIRTAALVEAIGQVRRKGGGRTNGWTIRRALEPLVVEGALVLPELIATRGDNAIAVTPLPGAAGHAGASQALTKFDGVRPLIGLGAAMDSAVPCLATPDVDRLLDLLESVAARHGISRSPLTMVADELAEHGWIGDTRLMRLFGERVDLPERLAPLTDEGEAVVVAGFGLCRVALLDEFSDRLVAGGLDLAGLRAAVSERLGNGPHADTLTLHLLAQRPLTIRSTGSTSRIESAAA